MRAPAMKIPEKINIASTAATTVRNIPMRRRSINATTPAIAQAPNTAVRKATPKQNSRSVRHQAVINPVATTAVAQPLIMLTAEAATAVALLGGCAVPGIRIGLRLMVCDASSPGTDGCKVAGSRPMMLVRVSLLSGCGMGPVG
jgi:hypothetical protein